MHYQLTSTHQYDTIVLVGPMLMGRLLKNSQIPNVDQFPWSTNKHPEFVRVVSNPCVMLDAYWTGEQVQGYDLHLGFVHLGCTN